MDWKSKELPKIIGKYQPKDIFNVDETGLFYNLRPSKTVTYKGDSCHGGTHSKQRVTVLLDCNADDTENIPPLVTGKYNKSHCFRNIKKTPHQIHSKCQFMDDSATTECLLQLDRQVRAKNRKILLFIDQCASHPRETTALKDIMVLFLPPNCTSLGNH
jgi:hypothetical protein